LGEIEGAASAEDMALWAKRALPTKNTLTAEDSALVEKAFAAKLEGLVDGHKHANIPVAGSVPIIRPEDAQRVPIGTEDAAKSDPPAPAPSAPAGSNTGTGCVQLAFGKTRRKRDKDHRAFVASKPCLVCGRSPADAHHLRFAQPRAMGRKVSDEFTVPLCRIHHRKLHLCGDEAAWWQEHKVDPLDVAQSLWRESRGLAPPESGPLPAT
jgi:hypothetical protein